MSGQHLHLTPAAVQEIQRALNAAATIRWDSSATDHGRLTAWAEFAIVAMSSAAVIRDGGITVRRTDLREDRYRWLASFAGPDGDLNGFGSTEDEAIADLRERAAQAMEAAS